MPPDRLDESYPKLRLVAIEGEALTYRDLRVGEALTVGHDPGAEWSFADRAISGRHVLLRASSAGRLELIPLSGKTLLNEVQVTGRAAAKPGDLIAIGGIKLILSTFSEPSFSEGDLRAATQLVDREAFFSRLSEEVDRGQHHGRPFFLVLLRRSKGAELDLLDHPHLRPVFAGQIGPEVVALLLSERPKAEGEQAVHQLALSLGREGAAFWLGHAGYPHEGTDPALLLEMAIDRMTGGSSGGAPEVLFVDPLTARLKSLVEGLAVPGRALLLCGEEGAGKRILAQAAGLSPARLLSLDGEVAGGGTLLWLRADDSPSSQVDELLAKADRAMQSPNPPMLVATSRTLPGGHLGQRFAKKTLWLPPLRDRRSEILPLAQAFLDRFRKALGKERVGIGKDAKSLLQNHPWPGNVRQLKNAMFEAAAQTSTEGTLTPDALPASLGRRGGSVIDAPSDLRGLLRIAEKEAWLKALEATRWNVSEAAKRLGVPRRTAVYRIGALGMKRPRPSR